MINKQHIPIVYLIVYDLLKRNSQGRIINFDTAEHVLNGTIRSKFMRMTLYFDMANNYNMLKITKTKFGSYIEVLPIKISCDINNTSSAYHYVKCW